MTQYAQELLSTFNTSIGEIALIPATGGIFTLTMTHVIQGSPESSTVSAGATRDAELPATVTNTVIWDRKTEGGFPETKELKNRVRNIIEPGMDLGHIDRSLKKSTTKETGLRKEENERGDAAFSKGDTETQIQHDPVTEHGARETKDCEDCQ